MKIGKALAFLGTLATIWGVRYMHDQTHGYDIVAAGAGSGGSGGSQEVTGDVGNTEVVAYVMDRRTGQVRVFNGLVEVPVVGISRH
jgi:hypothetical protein